jgi:hypothetical protein
MLPAYEASRVSCLFFIVYLIIGLFFLMNLLLAIFYNIYKSTVESSMTNFVDERDNYLKRKFNELDSEGVGYIDKKACKELIVHFLKLEKSGSVTSTGGSMTQHDIDMVVDMLAK